jgi:hypothetical protein
VFTESLYICLVTAAFICLVVPRERLAWAGAAAGGALGLAYLARPEAITLLPVTLLLLAFRWPERSWLARGGQALALVVGFVAVTAGPLAHLQSNGQDRSWHGEKAAFGAVLDERLVRMSLEEAYFALDESGERFEVSVPTLTASAATQLVAAPVDFVLRRVINAWEKAGELLPAGGTFCAGLGLIAIGVPLARRRPRELSLSVFLILLLGYTLALNIVTQARLHAMSVPPLFALVGWCLQLLASTSQPLRTWPRRLAQWLLMISVFGMVLIGVVGATVLVKVRAPYVFTAGPVAEWLTENTAPDAVLVTHEPSVPYYAGRPHRTLPAAASPDQLCTYLRTVNADCVVLTPFEVEAHALTALDTVPCLTAVPVSEELTEGVFVYAVQGGHCTP